ncbi:protein ABHD11 [Caerostris extrusa]|uniref:sn-1-specific diacylglycerol lipase ABHD11 n=1 Tax=Caerostris extrusa TaxID=172846 RepID=A0AAV4MPA5_CAEEX|nr:protein ABHD11 [Caerostris extrusa]
MKLAYEVILPPEGAQKQSLAPIIFLHGRLDSKKTWKKMAPVIAKKTGREVYLIDARNHGDSPWSDEMNIDVLPEAVEKLIVEDMVTQNYNSIAKRTIQQLIVLLRASLSAIPPKADEIAAKKAVVKFIKEKLPPAQTQLKERGLFDLDTIPLKKQGDSYAWKANLDVLEDMLMSDKGDIQLSGAYKGDALFLYGKESFFDVKGDEDIHKFFPCATKIGVEKCGHLIHQDFPDEFLKQVINFILI